NAEDAAPARIPDAARQVRSDELLVRPPRLAELDLRYAEPHAFARGVAVMAGLSRLYRRASRRVEHVRRGRAIPFRNLRDEIEALIPVHERRRHQNIRIGGAGTERAQHGGQRERLERGHARRLRDSNRHTPLATDTLRLATLPRMGMRASRSQR